MKPGVRSCLVGLMVWSAATAGLQVAFAGPAPRDGSPSTVAVAPQATEVIKFVPRRPAAGSQRRRSGEDPTTAGHDLSTSSALERADAWRYFGKSIWDPAFTFDHGRFLLCGANPAIHEAGFVVRVVTPLPERPAADGKASWPWVMVTEDGAIWVIRAGGSESPIRGQEDNISYYRWKNGSVASHEYIIGEPARGRVWTCHYVKVRHDDKTGEYVPLVDRRLNIRKLWL